MKNPSITIAVTALIAFSLGYFARGTIERAPSISKNPEDSTVRAHAESPAPQEQKMVRADHAPYASFDVSRKDPSPGPGAG